MFFTLVVFLTSLLSCLVYSSLQIGTVTLTIPFGDLVHLILIKHHKRLLVMTCSDPYSSYCLNENLNKK